MDPSVTSNYQPTAEDQQLQKQLFLQTWKERIYRFFYTIWPSVIRVLNFIFYHAFRIIRGFFRTALESIRGGS